MFSFQSIFVSKLGFFNALRILLSSELRRAPAVYYKQAGYWGRFLLRERLKPIPDNDYEPLHGSNFSDHRAHVTLDLAQELFAGEPDRYLRRFLQQAMAWSVYQPIGLIQDQELMKAESGRACVLVPMNAFMKTLKERYENESVGIRWGFGSKRPKQFLIHILAFGLTGLQALWTVMTRSSQTRTSGGSRPALSVLNFRGGQSFEQRNDFFWLSSTRPATPPAFPIVFEYASLTYPLSDQYLAELRSRNIRIVETHRWRKRLTQSEQWRPGRIFLRRSLTSIRRFGRDVVRALPNLSATDIWYITQQLHFELQRNSRLDFYDRYSIRAELISGFTTSESAHSAAMRELGGISCTAQYTSGIDPWGSYTSTSTFNLNFGEAVTTWGRPFHADFTILNGYPFRTAVARGVDSIQRIRTKLEQAGARRVVCFFDEGFLENKKTTQVTLDFARFLLTKLLAERDFGVILKPKKNALIAGFRSAFGSMFDDALASGRLAVLDWSYYPGWAGLAADFTVGLISTAPLEAAAAGGRVIYLNSVNYLPPMFREIRSHVYESVEDAITDTDAFLEGKGNPNLGVHPESFLSTIDAGRDGEVSQRIEYLLSSCLKQIEDGTPREALVKNTVAGLTRRWPVRCISKADSTLEGPGAPAGEDAVPQMRG